jgi:predicted nucleotidyltransferase component of viral defense system
MIAYYELYPILSHHYCLNDAFAQKVNALVHRTETQARDVFDLDHLLGRGKIHGTKYRYD